MLLSLTKIKRTIMGTEEVGLKSENIKIDIECPIKELGLHWKVNKVLWFLPELLLTKAF